MSKGASTTDTSEVEKTTLEDESLSTAQEAIPAPWGCGKFKVAPRYVSPIYGQRAEQAPNTRPGKK